jgi:hypothetical protein
MYVNITSPLWPRPCLLVMKEEANGRCIVKITSSGRALLAQRDGQRLDT